MIFPQPSPTFRAGVLMNGSSRLQGGMFHSVRRLWQSVQSRGHGVVFHTVEDAFAAQDRGVYAPLEMHTHKATWEKGFAFCPAMMAAVQAERDLSLLSLHGLWLYSSYVALRAMEERKLPLVVHPHGMMDPWAIANSRWKKRIAGALWHERLLRGATCYRALCQPEADAIRAYGLKTPVAVIPNGVELSEFEGIPGRDAIAARFPALTGRKRMLFMSRLHPKKGLPLLLEAWAKLPPAARSGWALLVAGEGEAAYEAELKAKTETLGLSGDVVFAGNLAGGPRREALGGCDAFALPSYSEGFSMAILEASACRMPVILTGPCNFPELAKAGGGIEVDPTVKGVHEALRQLFALPEKEQKAMGAKGRALIESGYTWTEIGAKMEALSMWLTGAGAKPETVQ